ncbi:MAG: CCA tRNA nucleotidyltransferase [Rhizobiaceae bacterium]|nr:CCA tRNA nucleotidyltransferase [Rhizobiaceae bacterium]
MSEAISPEWLADEALQKLLAVLSSNGEEARIAGGAVRNALLGQPVADIDIATTTTPDETIRRASEAGFRTVPTGAEHGTITVIAQGRAFEVTTLRADVETDGRHAKVVFGRDWRRDAERRDFTINALYMRADGTVVDLVGGRADIEARIVRFIGDADARIREDYLRILRFFRFFAFYGKGRPDADGLRACARHKSGLSHLSAERVWSEFRRLLGASDPSRTLLWMRQAGVLSAILPESEKWGIDSIHALTRAEADLGWPADPLMRLQAMVPPDAERMEALAERLRMSNDEAARMVNWAQTPPMRPDMSERAFRQVLYVEDRQGVTDRLHLALSGARARAVEDDKALVEAGGYARLLKIAKTWERPIFPVKGGDLVAVGWQKGPNLGATLRSLEEEWVSSDFTLQRGALLERAAEMAEPQPGSS